MSLCVQNLKDYKDEILKAEIGALLFNLGKTHIGFWKEKNGKVYFNIDETSFENIFGFKLFSGYKKYYEKDENLGKSPFEYELKKYGLKDFIFSKQVKFPFNINSKNEIKWISFFKGDALKDNEDGKEFIQKIFFRGCENINSGIDKGSPKKQLKVLLWLSNAFGSFKEEIKEHNFDKRRLCFYTNLSSFLNNNGYFQNPNWKEIRNFILKEIKNWYSNLLSDSRMPVNDVTLYDQAYMSASMFKATLAGILLNTNESKNYEENPQSIKWQILGIQYDKLSLAEKGLKPAHIIWYRENAKKVDEKVKEIIELDYALGNEIYRDESGIYFIVPEGIGDETLSNDLQEVKDKILSAFNDVFSDEVYPYIGLTKSSRGTMNLTYLLDKAKENFLKPDYSKKSSVCVRGNEIGICQICKNRLVKEKSDEDEVPMCNICKERKKGRIEKWLENQNGETIWIDEIGQTGSIALIGLKFELNEWLNGDLLSSLLVREENFIDYKSIVIDLIKLIKSQLEVNEVKKLNIEDRDINIIEKFLELFDEKGIQEPYKKNKEALQKNKNINNVEEKFRYLAKKLLKEEKWLEHFNFFENNKIHTNRKKSKFLTIDNYDVNNGVKGHLYKIFIINFLILQLKNILLERSIGNKWENFILDNLSDKSAIEFDKRKIEWNKLNNDDIEFLAKIILQFIFRKNPSPARLRRIWESTSEFFSKVKSEVFDVIEETRSKESFKKLVPDFANLNINNTNYKQYFSIIDPTPISWQVIIPTSKVWEVIEQIQKLYYENFKYVNGKLPLHIGVVLQKTKKPLYVGIKALRKMRRDIKGWSEIKKEGKNLLEDLSCYEKVIEQNNNTKGFYSLYETDDFDYDFKLLPLKKGVKLYNKRDDFVIYPNTFDFEFLDTNTRRNDIYYENGKRTVDLKQNRPYEWSEWKNFLEFKKEFSGKSALLHRLVSLIYSKMQDWKNNEESFKIFMKSTFKKEGIEIENFGIKNYGFKEMKKFIDMFEFWHTALKEI